MYKKSFVEHSKSLIEFEDGACERIDELKTHIPLSVLSEKDIQLLKYWCVEQFDYAHLDEEKGEFVLGYQTEHFLRAEDVEDEEMYDKVVEFKEGA